MFRITEYQTQIFSLYSIVWYFFSCAEKISNLCLKSEVKTSSLTADFYCMCKRKKKCISKLIPYFEIKFRLTIFYYYIDMKPHYDLHIKFLMKQKALGIRSNRVQFLCCLLIPTFGDLMEEGLTFNHSITTSKEETWSGFVIGRTHTRISNLYGFTVKYFCI